MQYPDVRWFWCKFQFILIMKNYKMSIAGIDIQLRINHEMEISNAFQNFMVNEFEKGAVPYVIDFKEAEDLHIPDAGFFYEEARTLIYRTGEGTFFRVFRESNKNKEIYAFNHCDFKERHIEVIYLKSASDHFRNMQAAFNHISWENILLNENKLMLHASYVETPFGGLAFSGTSGIGKSTQADLWVKHGNGRLLNGDKLVLSKEKKWNGYGSPYAGSSTCYINDYCAVNGLFFLSQGEACSLQPLSVAESFKKIYTGLTLNRWDAVYVEKACNLAYQLAQDVPAYEFVCTPDKNAVDFLVKKLS